MPPCSHGCKEKALTSSIDLDHSRGRFAYLYFFNFL
jgi:hypothetical protein